MHTYKFTNGDVVTSKLKKEELLKRMERLDRLRVLTEGFNDGVGFNIFKKNSKSI